MRPGILIFAVIGMLAGGCANPNDGAGARPANAVGAPQPLAKKTPVVTAHNGEDRVIPATPPVPLPDFGRMAPVHPDIAKDVAAGPRSTGILLTNVPPPAPNAPPAPLAAVPTATPGEKPQAITSSVVPATVTSVEAPPVPVRPDPYKGLKITLAVIGGSAALIAFAFYYNSETARVHRRVLEIRQSIIETQQGQKDIRATLQRAAQNAAALYQEETRRGYLSAISIDEIKRVASGVRLQPLRENGITTLLACQGWTAAKLIQLRGIGPDSASRIASACAVLTAGVNRRPIPHPRVSDMGLNVQQLYRRIHDLRQAHEKFKGQEEALGAILTELEPRIRSVEAQTTFFRWLAGSEKKGVLALAIKYGREIETQLAVDGDLGRILTDSIVRLSDARALANAPVPNSSLREDVVAHADLYRTFLDHLLGPNPAFATVSPSERMPVIASTEPVRLRTSGNTAPSFSIPKADADTDTPPLAYAPAASKVMPVECWVPAGRDAVVASVTIRGGLVYVGNALLSVNSRTIEPALVNARLPVAAREADCHTRMLNYWSSYSFASPAARASYLQWLGSGKCDPEADVGYVFLYYYGLERRVLADAATDPAARTEIPAIVEEVKRLRSIYGSNHSFGRYTSDFLDYVAAFSGMQSEVPVEDVRPTLTRGWLSFELRRKLGSLAAAKEPLPGEWAYIWYHNDARTQLQAPAERCPARLRALFLWEYNRQHGAGLVLPANKTRLKITYRPASASFGSPLVQAIDLPDVSVLSASYGKLESIGSSCFQQLDAYSRFIGRNPGAENSGTANLLLPEALWPESAQQLLAPLRGKAVGEATVLTFTLQEFSSHFGQATELGKPVYTALCRALGGAGIGIEPDPRFNGDVPSLDERVAFFVSDNVEQTAAAFGLASLLLQLASAVAASDGNFDDAEAQVLSADITANTLLTRAERQRLLARLAIFRLQAPPITGLKPTIERMAMDTRLRVIDSLLAMVYADRVIAPEEVKLMEKIYTLFGLDSAALYTRLHELSAGSAKASLVSTAARKAGPMQLDVAKIQQLKVASAEISKKLAVIFEEQTVTEVPEKAEPVEPAVGAQPSALDLDVPHHDLLTVLLGRAQWTREEFEELCADKGLMPDGAIERINEAAFNRYDEPLIEGENPLDIAVQLLQKT